MKTAVAFAAFLLCLSAIRAEENATYVGFKNAKVGDWASYKLKAAAGKPGQEVEITQKRTITAKDEKSITIKTETTVMGHATTHEATVPLDRPYNPAISDPESKVEKADEGDEKLTLNGKDYDTHWMHYTGKSKTGSAIDCKVWLAKDVPLGGMVKLEGVAERGKMSMELTGSGSE